ncbi:Rho-GAP domain-containing protein [Entamoeba marina]
MATTKLSSKKLNVDMKPKTPTILSEMKNQSSPRLHHRSFSDISGVVADVPNPLNTFLKQTSGISNRILVTKIASGYITRRTKLTEANTTKRKCDLFSMRHIEQNLSLRQTATQLEQVGSSLLESINFTHSQILLFSPKKITRLYFALNDDDDNYGEVVEYGNDKKKTKLRRVKLFCNFLVFLNNKGSVGEVIYLFEPNIEVDGNWIIVDKANYIKFSSKDKQDRFHKQLLSFKMWSEEIPMTILRNSENESSSKRHKRMETVDMDTLQSNLPQSNTPEEDRSPKQNVDSSQKKSWHFVDYGKENNTDFPPQNIMYVLDYLTENGYKSVGLFRISGDQADVNKLKNHLEGQHFMKTDLKKYDIPVIASTLKTYIREFPESLIPKVVDIQFAELLKNKSNLTEEEFNLNFVGLVGKLPPIVSTFYKGLMYLLHKVSEHSDINMMKAENLMICLGPALRGIPFTYNYAITHYEMLWK